MYEVVTQDLPPEMATSQTIQDLINETMRKTGTLVSATLCKGPNESQRLVIVFTRKASRSKS
jgi:hypothetical protein